MARVHGIELGATRAIERVRINNTRTVAIAVGQGVTALAWSFDMAQFTDPTEELRMIIDISTDNQVSWRESSISTFIGGSVSPKTGEPPSGRIVMPPGATHIRVTLIPMAGRPTIGVFAAAV